MPIWRVTLNKPPLPRKTRQQHGSQVSRVTLVHRIQFLDQHLKLKAKQRNLLACVSITNDDASSQGTHHPSVTDLFKVSQNISIIQFVQLLSKKGKSEQSGLYTFAPVVPNQSPFSPLDSTKPTSASQQV